MKSLRNSVQLIGRLGKDPEVKTFGDKRRLPSPSLRLSLTKTRKAKR
jgi:single-stranded DNA-binding protein